MHPPPPAIVAVRDTICAILRDRRAVTDSETIAHQLPPMLRWVPDRGMCTDNHAPIRRHRQIELRACFGDDVGHSVTYRLSTVEVYRECQALATAGYLQRFDASYSAGLPTRWLFIEPALASAHRQIEMFEAAEFAALAQLAGDPGPQR